MTLGRMLSELGNYASAILDGKHQRMAASCHSRLEKVICQLQKRDTIETEDDLFDFTSEEKEHLSTIIRHLDSPFRGLEGFSISELELLYWARHDHAEDVYESESTRMSGMYSEYEVVLELDKRECRNISGQLKKDYCTLTFQNELEYLSFLLDAPIGEPTEYVPMDRTCKYSPDELLSLIRTYSGEWSFKTVMQRLMLEQYVDYAIRYVDNCADARTVAPLIDGIARENPSLGK